MLGSLKVEETLMCMCSCLQQVLDSRHRRQSNSKLSRQPFTILRLSEKASKETCQILFYIPNPFEVSNKITNQLKIENSQHNILK